MLRETHIIGEMFAHWFCAPDPKYALVISHGIGAHGGIYDRFYEHHGAKGVELWSYDAESFFDDEVSRTFDALGNLAHPDRLFRPFCNAGLIDHRLFKKADIRKMSDAKITCVLFNSVPRDWEHADAWVNRALSELTTRPWTTIVMHDIYGYPDGVDVRAMSQLDRFMSVAKEQGQEFLQEFSPDCVPIRRGDICFDIQSLAN